MTLMKTVSVQLFPSIPATPGQVASRSCPPPPPAPGHGGGGGSGGSGGSGCVCDAWAPSGGEFGSTCTHWSGC